MVLSQSASNACCLRSTTCKRTALHICKQLMVYVNDAVHGRGHEAVETSVVTEQQPSVEPTEVAYEPSLTQADAPLAEAKAADVMAESLPAEAEPAVAEAEPAVAEAEPTVAEAEPAVAKAEPAVAEAESTDSMPEWASLSEEAITAGCKQLDEFQPAAAEHVIANLCETESPASDTAAAHHVIHDDTDTTDLAQKALVLEQDPQVYGTAGIHALSEGTIHLWTSVQLQRSSSQVSTDTCIQVVLSTWF